MTPRDQIIEVMARAIAEQQELSAGYAAAIRPELTQMAIAALTALESSGYIVRPREATEGMLDAAWEAPIYVGMADNRREIIRMKMKPADTAMTEAWEKEQNDVT